MTTAPKLVSPTTDEALDVQAFFEAPRATRAERAKRGRELRSAVPLDQLAAVPTADQRADARTILAAQAASQPRSLTELHRERMTADPVAFLRAAAAVMAADLATQPNSGITVQLCGDAHVANFGMFASPRGRVVFDLNDFDETLPGPFEWDVKRLATSLAVAARDAGHKKRAARKASRAAAETYRVTMSQLAGMRTLDVWFARLDFDELLAAVKKTSVGKAGVKTRKASGGSAAALTEVVAGRRRFRADRPLVVPVSGKERDQVIGDLTGIYADYLATLPPDRIALLSRYSFVDVAHEVVGVGSVGVRAVLLLLESGDGEPLMLQLKQAGPSVLEPHLRTSRFSPAGKRVVVGQQVLQATDDPFLGWCGSRGDGEANGYVRQVREVRSPIDTTRMAPKQLVAYARICGSALARAHARGGDASLIGGYVGDEHTFDDAITDFAMSYVGLNRRDFAAFADMSTVRS